MSKFTIYAGRQFKADFTVVDDGGQTGQELSESDTATFSIVKAGANPTCVLDGVEMTISDAENGVFELVMTAEETALLEQYVGFQEDGFSPIANYVGYLDFTLESGDRQSTINISVLSAPTCA